MYSITYYELIFSCVEMMRVAEEKKRLIFNANRK